MQKLNEIWAFLLPYLKNKYIISILIFIIWISFFDRNDLIERFSNIRELQRIEQEKEFYKKKIEEYKKRMNELQTDRENLEKFAREQYLMKKPGEDIFIIEKKKE